MNEKTGGKTSGKMGESCLLCNWRGGTTGRRRTGGSMGARDKLVEKLLDGWEDR